jgi:hypothetical protein
VDQWVELAPACCKFCIPCCSLQWLHALLTDSGSTMQWNSPTDIRNFAISQVSYAEL